MAQGIKSENALEPWIYISAEWDFVRLAMDVIVLNTESADFYEMVMRMHNLIAFIRQIG